jgi:hypothetical protein
VTAHNKQLGVWAANCPENFVTRVALVSAEIARIEGRDLDAMRFYDQAIRCARENAFIHIEGVANEVAARFYLARGFERIASAYLREAGTAIFVGKPSLRCDNSISYTRSSERKSQAPVRRARSGHRSNTWTWLRLSKSRKRCRVRSSWRN